MDLIDRIKELAARAPKLMESVQTEEATKNALVMPFINALGYDVFDPTEVIPEYTADVGTKRGEKVDYAIARDGQPVILIECKALGAALAVEHASQLYRYFSVTEARFAVLTDGVNYKFYTDLEARNKMDSRPFLEFNLLEPTEQVVRELKKFTKDSFDIEKILSTASELKYTRGIKRILSEEWANPSDDLVRMVTSRVYSGRLTHAVRGQFTEITKRALHEFLSERVSQRLKSALEQEHTGDEDPDDSEIGGDESEIVTTEDELEGFYMVKAILAEVTDPRRVFIRDRKRYCGILLDDTNRKPICRFWFNGSQKYLGLFDTEKNEEKMPIERTEDIFQHAQRLRETVLNYEGTPPEKDRTT